MSRNVLVISTVERSAAVVREAVGGEIDQLHVVVPAVHQSRLDWLANADNDAIDRADRDAHEIGDGVAARETTSSAGDSDPLVAVADAFREFAIDEVVVITRPDEQAIWLEEGKGREIAKMLQGVPVRRVELGD